MSKRVKMSVFGGVILVLAAIGGLTAAKSGKKATEVRTELVQGRDLVASVTASGQVRPQTKVDLSSDITGKIVKLAVKEGQMVTKGQFLLQIDAQQAEANVQRMQASLASSRAQMARHRPTCCRRRRATSAPRRSRRRTRRSSPMSRWSSSGRRST